MDETRGKLKIKLSGIFAFLNEKQRRLLAGTEAASIGHGGIKILSDVTGMDRKTVRRGINDLKKNRDYDRVRACGGGRKKITEQNPEITEIIEELIEPDTSADSCVIRSPIPVASDHLFLSHPITYSCRIRSLIPARSDHLFLWHPISLSKNFIHLIKLILYYFKPP